VCSNLHLCLPSHFLPSDISTKLFGKCSFIYAMYSYNKMVQLSKFSISYSLLLKPNIDPSVFIASHMLNDSRLLGLILGRSRDYFSYSTDDTLADGPNILPPSAWPVFFTWEQQLIHEADHSCPSSAAVKNACSYTSILQCVFKKWYLIRQSDKFKFTFIPKHYTLFKKDNWKTF